jgi:hypothetical protein
MIRARAEASFLLEELRLQQKVYSRKWCDQTKSLQHTLYDNCHNKSRSCIKDIYIYIYENCQVPVTTHKFATGANLEKRRRKPDRLLM